MLFWIFATVAVLAAVLCITRRSAVASALWLVMVLFALAAIFVLLNAQFIAVLQVMVYAGAIMVLFLFVIMLLNLSGSGPSDMRGWPGRVLAGLIFAALVFQLWAIRWSAPDPALMASSQTPERLAAEQGVIGMIADPLFSKYLIPFELTSILLLAAVVGAVVLAKRRL